VTEQPLSAAVWGRRAPSLPRSWRGKWTPIVCGAVIAALTLAALAAPLLPHDPLHQDLAARLLPPAWVDGGSSEHLLGTDSYGRDVLSRLVYGARVSLGVAALAITMGTLLGATTGVVAGYFGGWIDAVLMRAVDLMLSLPALLVGIAAAIALGPSMRNVVLIITVLISPRIARQIRGDALAIRHQDFVQYARGAGRSRAQIMVRHILPNVTPTLLVMITLEVGHVVLLEATLSFLGAGVPPPAASWGTMVSDGRALLSTGWWVSLFPGLLIIVTILALNTLGDWLRDYLDPRLKLGR
jgi:peptide/nickel transport system permease protein